MNMKTATSMLFAFCMVSLVGCVADTPPGTATGSGGNAEMQALLEEFPEATQIDDHSISWDDGKVVLVLQEDDAGELSAEDDGPESSAVVGSSQVLPNPHGCPPGWYCVYEHRNWGVRRLQFSDCTRNDLGNYGFRNMTSSWVNNGSRTVQAMDDIPLLPDRGLWTMPPQSLSAYVGDANNDKADYFRCL